MCDVGDLLLLHEELKDRLGEPPEPLRNLIALQLARMMLGYAGAASRATADWITHNQPVDSIHCSPERTAV